MRCVGGGWCRALGDRVSLAIPAPGGVSLCGLSSDRELVNGAVVLSGDGFFICQLLGCGDGPRLKARTDPQWFQDRTSSGVVIAQTGGAKHRARD